MRSKSKMNLVKKLIRYQLEIKKHFHNDKIYHLLKFSNQWKVGDMIKIELQAGLS